MYQSTMVNKQLTWGGYLLSKKPTFFNSVEIME